jgi:hypothetical protein
MRCCTSIESCLVSSLRISVSNCNCLTSDSLGIDPLEFLFDVSIASSFPFGVSMESSSG